MASTTVIKPRISLKSLWNGLRPSRKAAGQIGEETKDAAEELVDLWGSAFQEIMLSIMMTTLGVLMIMYIAGYPGGLVALLAALMIRLLPGVPFDSAWLSLGVGIYILTSICITFVHLVLQASITTRAELILDRLDKLGEDVEEISYGKDLLTESMANLSDKLDEVKLHL